MDLGSRIKTEREKLNLSQDDLAQRMDISRQAISKWETGKSYPDIEKILQLSNIFSLSLDELVKGDKNFQENLIREGRSNISGLTILGYLLIVLSVIVGIWGGALYPINLMNSDFMSFLVGGLVLLTIGAALIRNIPVWLLIGAVLITAVSVIVYLIGFKMDVFVLLAGIAAIVACAWWIVTLILKR